MRGRHHDVIARAWLGMEMDRLFVTIFEASLSLCILILFWGFLRLSQAVNQLQKIEIEKLKRQKQHNEDREKFFSQITKNLKPTDIPGVYESALPPNRTEN